MIPEPAGASSPRGSVSHALGPSARGALPLLPLLLLSVSLAAGPARAGSDPSRRWFVEESDHFAVYSYQGGEALAREVAGYCEEAWRTLNPVLGWTPRQRVHVKIIDDQDAANGFAFVRPYDAITLYAFPPPAESELGDYSSWLKLLVFHEYTHILHLDNSGGVPELVNRVFGRAVKPNEVLPRWITEGIAVWIESTTTGGGRVGSSRMEMYLRTAALGGELPTLSELTGPPLRHPRGTSWYLYGGYLFDHIARAVGAERVRAFIRAYGRRGIPYGINLTAKTTTGKRLDQWFAEILAEIRQRAAAVVARIEAAGGPVEGLPLTTGGEFNVDARFSPDGRGLAWVRSDGHSPAQIVLAPAGPLQHAPAEPGRGRARPLGTSKAPSTDALGADRRVIRCEGGCSSFEFTRDGRELAFGTSRSHRLVSFHGAIALVPARPGRDRRDARVFAASHHGAQPTPSADGRRLWFVVASWGRTWLSAVDLATGDEVARIDPPPRARLDHPVASPDGRSLYVSMHSGGNRDLYRVDIQTHRFERLTEGAAIELSPTLSVDGRWLVYSSDADGVYDIYARDLEGGAGTRRLTRVTTGAFDPALSPDGRWLVYSRWSSAGFDLWRLPFSPEGAPRVLKPDPRPARPEELPLATPMERRDYQSLPTMLPRSWLPTWVADSAGVSRLGLTLAGVDVAGRLAASLIADWDLSRGDLSASASLIISTAFPDLTLSAGRYSWDRSSFLGDALSPYREEVWYASASASLPVPSVFTGLHVGLGYTADLSRALSSELGEHRPDENQAFVPSEGLDTALNLFWSLNDAKGFTFSVSPQVGGSAHMNLSLRDPALGSRGTTYTLSWAAHAYLPMLFDDHVLALRLGGGLSGGDPSGRSLFSLGGPPAQDLLTDLLNQTSAGAVWLRGFEPGAFYGTSFALLTVEYRLPLLRVRRGLDSLPVFIEDLSVALFSDLGAASFDPFGAELWGELHGALGAELRWRADLFYGLSMSFRLGWGHGLGAEGIDQVYLLMAPAP